MMTSDTPLGETLDTSKLNFREKTLANMSPTTAEKVFTFIKEKQETIQTAKTEAELDNLKAGILPTITPTPEVTPTPDDKTEDDKIEDDKTEDDKTEDDDKTKEADKNKKNSKENIIASVGV